MRSYKPNKKQKEVILKWIERLRNPSSRKARHYLKKGSGYCCLGHLCKVVDLKFSMSPDDRNYKCLGEELYLPDEVSNMLGLESNPSVCIGDDYYELADLNDNHEFTLSELADLIEADWIKGKPLKSDSKLPQRIGKKFFIYAENE